jgi:beta-glucanase (GH16 family)
MKTKMVLFFILLAFKSFSQYFSITYLPSETLDCGNESWKLVFYDEFNGSQINSEKWATFYNDSAPVSSCLHCRIHDFSENNIYFDQNVTVDQGKLKLIAKRESAQWLGYTKNYTSGMVQSKSKFFLGKFEIMAKIPYGQGFWPAFWLFGEDENEIDVFEFGTENTHADNTNLRAKIDGNIEDWKETYNSTIDFSAGFNKYTLEWEQFEIIYKVNDIVIRRIPRYATLMQNYLYCGSQISEGTYLYNILMPDYPLNVILNLAVSSSTTGYGDEPLPTTTFPNEYLIDYIRIYQKIPNSGYQDLCAGRGISGPNVICSGSKTYTFTGESSNLVWSVSPNLVIDNQSAKTITVHPLNTSVNAAAWIKSSDDIPCTQSGYTKNIWIGRPTLPIVGDIELIVRQNGFAHLNYPSGTVSSVVWSKSGDLTSISGTLTDAIYKAGASAGIGYVYANVSNTCATIRQEMEVYVANVKFNLYPNPCSEYVMIDIFDEELKDEMDLRCIIYDLNHNPILEKNVIFGTNKLPITNYKGLSYLTITKGKDLLFSTSLIVN